MLLFKILVSFSCHVTRLLQNIIKFLKKIYHFLCSLKVKISFFIFKMCYFCETAVSLIKNSYQKAFMMKHIDQWKLYYKLAFFFNKLLFSLCVLVNYKRVLISIRGDVWYKVCGKLKIRYRNYKEFQNVYNRSIDNSATFAECIKHF